MKRTLRFSIFSSTLIIATTAFAQKDRFAYAITDVSKEGSGWNALRKIDLQTGKCSPVLMAGNDAKTVVYEAGTKKEMAKVADARHGTLFHAPFSTGVAAAAYDRKHHRLYFTPMFIDQLRYIDLKSMKVYYVTDQPFTKHGNMHNTEGKCITRMVIAPDGNGYALSSDGNTFIRFSTGKKTKITQLGALTDDPANGKNSIHHRHSFGGDMISDDKGNLYIFSARNQVFKVNTETRVAKHLGAIEGLPKNFTINGAVVDGDGNLLVSSAVYGKASFVVNPKDWTASQSGVTEVVRSSDLANGNYIATPSSSTPTIETIARVQPTGRTTIQVYPNPVTANQFTLKFTDVPAGDYTLELTDVIGRRVLHKRFILAADNGIETVSLAAANAKGIYLVKVIDRSLSSIFEQKLIVE